MAAQLAAEALGIERVIAKINDPVRAEAYAELGIATLCRTGLMVDAINALPRAAAIGPARDARADRPPSRRRTHPTPAAPAARRRRRRRRPPRPGRPEPCSCSSSAAARSATTSPRSSSSPGHEVALMEKDPARARPDRRRDRLDRHRPRRLRGQVPRRGRLQPGRRRGGGDRRRRGQPRHLPDGQAPLRRAADDRPGQQPQERGALPAPRRGRADQPDPDDPGLDRAGHPGPRAAPPGRPRRGRARAHRGAPPGRLAGHRPGAADLAIPEGCSLFAVIRDGVATPLRPDTVMLEGDKVIAIGKQECQDLLHDQLIGDPEALGARAEPSVGHLGAGTGRGRPTRRCRSQCKERATLLTTSLSRF